MEAWKKNFRVDISSFVHVDNKNKDISILVAGPDDTLTVEAKYPINFTLPRNTTKIVY